MRRDLITTTLQVAVACSVLWIAAYAAGFRPLSFDEIEFARATRWISRGGVPYLDFWEHHTPLQWYVFAPVERLLDGPGVATIVALRFAQLIAWAVTLAILVGTMRRMALSSTARLTAMALLLASAAFAMPAVEYRVDALGTLFVVAALRLTASARSVKSLAAIGALSALAILTNMRFAAIAAVLVVLAILIDAGARRWRWPRFVDAAAAFSGGVAVVAVYCAYLAITQSFGAFRAHMLADNSIMGGMFARYAQRTFWAALAVPVSSVDIGAITFAIAAVVGFAIAVARIGRPGELQVVALLNAVSIAAIWEMPVHYPYHFISAFVIAAPLVAVAADAAIRRSERWSVAFAVGVVCAVIMNLLFLTRASRVRIEYQDEIMRSADAMTRPDEAVWDGVGFALRRRPAYRYWFLPLGVRYLVMARHIEPFTAASVASVRPAAIVLDRRAASWMLALPGMPQYVAREYVPVYLNLWVPGLSARVMPGQTVNWTVFRDGEYRLVAAPSLAGHLWFDQPLVCGMMEGREARKLEIETERFHPPPPGALSLAMNGAALSPAHPMQLVKGMQLRLTSRAAVPVGVFIIPQGVKRLFASPPGGVTFNEPLFELR